MLPTELAEGLAGHAARIFAELRHLDSDIAGIAGDVAGAVVVGTTPLGRSHVFTSAIAAACDRHRSLRVTTIESSYGDLIANLRRGSIDLIVGVPRPAEESAGLKSETLFVDHLVVLVGAQHPLAAVSDLAMVDLLEHRWILPRSSVLGRSFIEGCFETMGLTPPMPAIETGDPAIIRQLLVSTDMIAASSPHQLRPELEARSVIELPVLLPGAERVVGLIQREGAMLSSAALAVADEIRQQAKLLPTD
jgi:LysR family transcriptional regulator of gallate degradation